MGKSAPLFGHFRIILFLVNERWRLPSLVYIDIFSGSKKAPRSLFRVGKIMRDEKSYAGERIGRILHSQPKNNIFRAPEYVPKS